MNAQSQTHPQPQPQSQAVALGTSALAHALRFDSLFHPGRGVVVPCDASGRVDLDTLTERLRNAYLGARALVGRDYACPRVQPAD